MESDRITKFFLAFFKCISDRVDMLVSRIKPCKSLSDQCKAPKCERKNLRLNIETVLEISFNTLIQNPHFLLLNLYSGCVCMYLISNM